MRFIGICHIQHQFDHWNIALRRGCWKVSVAHLLLPTLHVFWSGVYLRLCVAFAGYDTYFTALIMPSNWE